jgi:hypothetical protein
MYSHIEVTPGCTILLLKEGEEVNALDVNLGLRPTQDYWYLNTHMVQDRYPLPLLSEILHAPKLQTVKYFMVMDIHWGFNNIQIKEGNEWKAAFITNHGLFKPLVMFFGMCNTLASFQQIADMILQPLVDQGCVFVYIDDMLIAGDTLQELDHWVWKVLAVMQDANLSCKPVKCQFERMTVKSLVTYLTQGQITVKSAKVTTNNEWPVPQKLKDVESFLSMINFW